MKKFNTTPLLFLIGFLFLFINGNISFKLSTTISKTPAPTVLKASFNQIDSSSRHWTPPLQAPKATPEPTVPKAIVHSPTIAKTVSLKTNSPIKTVSSSNKALYVKRFSKTAVSEMHRYGIPASITLAQGLLESSAGKSKLATRNNNHFGIKCFSKKCKKGHCSNYSDDSHKDFFRQYNTAWESYRAHSKFLMKPRYRPLFKYGKDYKKWAKGLARQGYATDPAYADKLIAIIEKLNLDRFDKH